MHLPFIHLSRLTVVSREAKKEQNDRQKQNARRTTVCLLHKQTFSSYDVIIIVHFVEGLLNIFFAPMTLQNITTPLV